MRSSRLSICESPTLDQTTVNHERDRCARFPRRPHGREIVTVYRSTRHHRREGRDEGCAPSFDRLCRDRASRGIRQVHCLVRWICSRVWAGILVGFLSERTRSRSTYSCRQQGLDNHDGPRKAMFFR